MGLCVYFNWKNIFWIFLLDTQEAFWLQSMTVVSHSKYSGHSSLAPATSAFQHRSYECGTVAAVRAPQAMHYPWAHPCRNPSKKRKGLKSNKNPLSSCSEDTVLTNSPQKVRSCNLLLWRGWEAGSQVPVISVCEVWGWKHKKSHRRCPFERLENIKPPATVCWGKSPLQLQALSTQRRIVSSRFIHFSWHLSLVLQMLHYI